MAAAYDFASDLTQPKLVLMVDLGGGTSDFTLVNMGPSGFRRSDVLSVGGVAVAGDALDGALVRCAVAPALGSEAQFRVPFGSNILPMPKDLIELLCSPADLTLADRKNVLRRLDDIQNGLIDRSQAAALEKFAVIVEDGVGFDLYEAVEGGKRRLSDAEETRVSLDYPGAEFQRTAERAGFYVACERPIERIFHALDRTLETASARHEQVDIVCLTGGTSRMPLIEQEILRRMPQAQVRRMSSFHSVVQGLARHAEELTRA